VNDADDAIFADSDAERQKVEAEAVGTETGDPDIAKAIGLLREHPFLCGPDKSKYLIATYGALQVLATIEEYYDYVTQRGPANFPGSFLEGMLRKRVEGNREERKARKVLADVHHVEADRGRQERVAEFGVRGADIVEEIERKIAAMAREKNRLRMEEINAEVTRLEIELRALPKPKETCNAV
jgi:hypothetical protein